MIIHNTTYNVLPDSEENWITWTKDHHIPKIQSLPGVKTCQFLKLLTEIDSEGITYTIQVELDSLPHAEAFLAKHDPELQTTMMSEFSQRVVYFQTLLRVM